MSNSEATAQTRPVIRLHPSDNVLIALRDLPAGSTVEGVSAPLAQAVPRGHKIATAAIAAGQQVIRYGQIIGNATKPIAAGEHIHTHNLGMGDHSADYAFASESNPQPVVTEKRSFMGYPRADGKYGTRNYLGILTSVNCSASVAKFIAEAVERAGWLKDYPNVDGVVAIVHGTGCGMSGKDEGYATLMRTLQGYAKNPNFGAILVVGLGCEVLQVASLVGAERLRSDGNFRHMTIQDVGGTRRSVERGVAALKEMAAMANEHKREPAGLEHLMVGMQCGGSDG